MSDNKTDEQILREYNDCVYNSEIYKRYNSFTTLNTSNYFNIFIINIIAI